MWHNCKARLTMSIHKSEVAPSWGSELSFLGVIDGRMDGQTYSQGRRTKYGLRWSSNIHTHTNRRRPPSTPPFLWCVSKSPFIFILNRWNISKHPVTRTPLLLAMLCFTASDKMLGVTGSRVLAYRSLMWPASQLPVSCNSKVLFPFFVNFL